MRKHVLWALLIVIAVAPLRAWQQPEANAPSTAPQVQTNAPEPHPAPPPPRVNFYRPDFSQQVIKTYHFHYLSQPTQIQDVVNMLRTVLEFTRVQPIPSPPTVVVRGTPEQIERADKLVAELDRPSSAAAAAQQNPTYRVEFMFTELEDGKKVNTRSYAIDVVRGTSNHDASKGMFRVGSRVPVATGSFRPGSGSSGSATAVNTQFQYIDIGMNVDCRLWGSDDDLTLHSAIEVSSVSTPQEVGGTSQPVVRQTKTELESAITPGKPSVIASLDEVDSPRRIEIAVTATKLK